MSDVNEIYYPDARNSPALGFLKLYDAGRVQRFHTTPDYSGATRQNLAEHSWGVAMVCIEICRRTMVTPSTPLLRAALTHDLAEYWTTDCPAHVKWEHPALAEALDNAQTHVEVAVGIWNESTLHPFEKRMLKWADGIELYVYSRQRARAGVASYQKVAENIGNYLGRMKRTDSSDDAAFRLLLDLIEAMK